MVRITAVIILAFFFSSCSNKSQNDLAVFKATEEGFLYSNAAISNSTDVIYRALHEKLLQPETAMQASKWQPKAMLIKEKSAETFKYLDSLITELKKEADIRLMMEEMREVYDEDDMEAVSKLFVKKNAGDKLFEKLQKYKMDMLAVDPEMNELFRDNTIIVTREFEQSGAKQKDFTTTFFDGVPAIAAVAMLRRFENNVRVLENKFVTFCFNKIGSLDGYGFFTKIGVLIGQSTNIIKAGDQMIIQAGMGEYSIASNPKITINNKKIQVENGVALYKFKTSIKAGKYFVPVRIEYIDVDGTKKEFMEKVEYTVVE